MKFKSIFTLLLTLCLFPITDIKATDFEITSDHVILYNLNEHEVLCESNSQEEVSIASLTKIMTAIVSIEMAQDINQTVNVPWEAFIGLEGYSTAGLRAGDEVTIKELIYATLLPSGAEAANSLAYIIGNGDYESFIEMMNQKAYELGLTHTKFDNVVGMDSVDNYSTASDIAILLDYCLKNDTFRQIFTTRYSEIASTGLELVSTIIKYSEGYGIDTSLIKGSKTGFTYDAGYCLASISTINNVDYLLVVLGSDLDYSYNALVDSITIYEYYSSHYGYHDIMHEGDIVTTIPVKLGKIKEYEIKIPETRSQYLSNEFNIDEVVLEYHGIEELNKKIKVNDYLGYVDVIYHNEKLDTIDIYLTEELEYYYPLLYIALFLLFVLVILTIRYILIKRKRYLRKQARLYRNKRH